MASTIDCCGLGWTVRTPGVRIRILREITVYIPFPFLKHLVLCVADLYEVLGWVVLSWRISVRDVGLIVKTHFLANFVCVCVCMCVCMYVCVCVCVCACICVRVSHLQ